MLSKVRVRSCKVQRFMSCRVDREQNSAENNTALASVCSKYVDLVSGLVAAIQRQPVRSPETNQH